jgi:hypothetical protein
MALLALPKPLRDQPMLVRADSAAATHAFTDELARRNLAFSIGFDCDQRVQRAILGLPEPAWQPAVDPDGRPRRVPGSLSFRTWTLPLLGLGANDAWPWATALVTAFARLWALPLRC